ncbi:FAD-dependent thymidylate synthase [Acidipila sp. EB88]|uniref:FAD-dependent thymidylate synthase n=1 Tax=Acidipila sp. EB88 TaxID=2305226 RepID=UPI001F37493F|nr:FAD-dependent thymidylate synthase [Acidipila sp. EB88]
MDSQQKRTGTQVYAVHGADPEVLAYAMAKYSRSALSLKESLREISAQRAEQFLNTFYFQYGHRSIADLAHLAFAVEQLSLLAAIVLVDEQRWDGQERSTRYQDFERSGWYTPRFLEAADTTRYDDAVRSQFGSYREVSDGVFAELRENTERPAEMKQESFERTLRARAFDVARYLLPLAANTSLGQIVNARTLETQVSRLLSSPLAEIRALGEQLREAAGGVAWNPLHADESAGAEARREVRVAPTLVKYAVPNRYAIETRALMAEAAAALMGDTPVASAPLVDLVDDADALEVDLAASLLYPASRYPYRQLRDHVAALSETKRDEIIDLGLRERGRHDELLREFTAGQRMRFDILMDIGGFRDMHRHRRCVQLLQGFTGEHGWETPDGLGSLAPVFARAMAASAEAVAGFDADRAADLAGDRVAGDQPAWTVGPHAEARQYLLPLATRTRALFRMDFAEALYIAELRSAPQGHLSYRRVAWEMYQAVARKHPGLARHFRVSPVETAADLLKR